MRPEIRIELEKDPNAPQLWCVMLYGSNGVRVVDLARRLEKSKAELLLVPCRKAFMAGVEWMREDSSSYIQTSTPKVLCGRSELP